MCRRGVKKPLAPLEGKRSAPIFPADVILSCVWLILDRLKESLNHGIFLESTVHRVRIIGHFYYTIHPSSFAQISKKK